MTLLNAQSQQVRITEVRESVDKGLWIIDCQPVEHPGLFQILTRNGWKASLCERLLNQVVIVTWAEREDDYGIKSGFKNLVKVERVQTNEAA